jgi:hypothetical protein
MYGQPPVEPPAGQFHPWPQPRGDHGRRPVRVWPPARPEWVTALVLIAALAAVGAALAPLWVHLAPRLAFRVDQPGRALPVVPEAEEYVAADGRFVLITLAVGVVAGFACWRVRRARGPLVLLALAAGGLLGAVVTWRLGLRIGTGYRPDDLQVVGTVVRQPLALRARSALVVEPVAAVICYLLAVGFSARNDLGRDEPDPAAELPPGPAPGPGWDPGPGWGPGSGSGSGPGSGLGSGSGSGSDLGPPFGTHPGPPVGTDPGADRGPDFGPVSSGSG